jgi:hypothetical protein
MSEAELRKALPYHQAAPGTGEALAAKRGCRGVVPRARTDRRDGEKKEDMSRLVEPIKLAERLPDTIAGSQ